MHRAFVTVLFLLAACRDATPAKAPDETRPELFLITALPIVWGEEFGLDQQGSPALKALELAYRVRPIDLPSQLPDGVPLLAAQPRALPAEELVALDAWLRRGGRLLLLADPMLEWPSILPPGDPRRAPVAFADTGLLQHWGLRLDALDERGPRQLSLDGQAVLVASPGTLVRTDGACDVGSDGLTASCAIGRGRVRVIVDADFVNSGPGGPDGPTQGNLAALLSQLAALTR